MLITKSIFFIQIKTFKLYYDILGNFFLELTCKRMVCFGYNTFNRHILINQTRLQNNEIKIQNHEANNKKQ